MAHLSAHACLSEFDDSWPRSLFEALVVITPEEDVLHQLARTLKRSEFDYVTATDVVGFLSERPFESLRNSDSYLCGKARDLTLPPRQLSCDD